MNKLESVWKKTDFTKNASTFERLLEVTAMSFRALKVAPLPFCVAIISTAAVISAVALILSLVLNLSVLVDDSHKDIPVSVYLNENAAEISEIRSQLLKSQGVDRVTYTSKQDALSTFRRSLGADAKVLDGVEQNNPLPASFEVYFKSQEGLSAFIDQMMPIIKQNPNIASVEVDQTLIGAIHTGVKSLSLLFFVGGGLLLALAASVIACAVTLILHAHRREIEVLSLVGAKELFIQAPYIVEGAVQGLLGGVLGSAIAWGAIRVIHRITLTDGILKQFISSLCEVSGMLIFILCILSLIVGACSSWVCVKRAVKV